MDSSGQSQLDPNASPAGLGTGAAGERIATGETGAPLRAELAALRADLERNDRQIDQLQMLAAERGGPWYRNIQTLVAIFALLLSLVTATVSGYWGWTQSQSAEERLRQQQVHDAKTELRGLLQAIEGLRREAEAQTDMSGNPIGAIVVATSRVGEMSLLADQADAVMQTIPEHVSATEYLSLIQALLDLGKLDRAAEMLAEMRSRAQTSSAPAGAAQPSTTATAMTPSDTIVLQRLSGMVAFNNNDYLTAREHMRQALAIGSEHYDAGLLASSWPQVENLRTELIWTFWEVWGGYCEDAREHLQAATALHRDVLPASDSPIGQQYIAMKAAADTCVATISAPENAGSSPEVTIPAFTYATIPLRNDDAMPQTFMIPALDISDEVAPGQTEALPILSAPPGQYPIEVATADGAESASRTVGMLHVAWQVYLVFDEFHNQANNATIPAYTDVILLLSNAGVLLHTFSIPSLGLFVDVPPGETVRQTVWALPGSYSYCVDGDPANSGTLTVLTSPQPPDAPIATGCQQDYAAPLQEEG